MTYDEFKEVAKWCLWPLAILTVIEVVKSEQKREQEKEEKRSENRPYEERMPPENHPYR